MFCEKCGTKVEENTKYCPKCGNEIERGQKTIGYEQPEPRKISEEQEDVKESSRNKGRIKLKTKIMVAVLMVLILLAGGIATYLNSPVYSIRKAIHANDIAEVVWKYNSSIDGNWILEKATTLMIEKHINEQIEAYKNGEATFEDVHRTLTEYMELDNDEIYDMVEKYQTNIQSYQESYSIFQTAEQFYEEGDYASAIKNYELVLENKDFSETATEKIKESKSSLKESALEMSSSLTTIEEYEGALRILTTVVDLLPDDEEIVKRNQEVNGAYLALVKKNATNTANDAIAKEDYETAFTVLSSAIEKLPDDTELNNMLTSVVQTYEGNIISLVDSYVAEKKYNDAIVALNTALKVIPSQTLTQKLETVTEMKPIPIDSLATINGGFEWNEGSPEDPFGNTYNNAVNYAIFYGDYSGEELYEEYRLYGEYSQLNFSVAPFVNIPEDGYGQVKIYADDKLMFTSDSINRKTDLKNYTIDIIGAEYIKIVVTTNKSDYGSGDMLLLLNVTLEK